MTPVDLFLAIFPDSFAAGQISDLANLLRAKHGLRGKPLAETRFHLTLLWLGHYDCVPEDCPASVRAAAEEAAGPVPPFEVVFDRAGSFGKNRPFVLRRDGGNVELRRFQKELAIALKNHGVRCDPSGFEPHITLLYDDRVVREQKVEPVNWVVNKFALVCSFVGQTKYRRLGEWNLRG